MLFLVSFSRGEENRKQALSFVSAEVLEKRRDTLFGCNPRLLLVQALFLSVMALFLLIGWLTMFVTSVWTCLMAKYFFL